MSIGELITLYRDGEMDIHPEFQRFFRWTETQKSKLIESILLGIPIPSIFVSQREDGVWDVIDGLQRLSTIFEFVGELKNEEGKKLPPSKLLKTEYLPSLKGKVWDSEIVDISFTVAQRLMLKRAKLDIKIIKKQSDKDAKYELFQRLNTGGSSLSPQEIRNCLLVMLNIKFYRWLLSLSNYPAFKNCIVLSDRLVDEQYDMELALRFFVYKNSNEKEIKEIKDIGDFITKKMLEFASDKHFDYKGEKLNFERTFSVLNEITGDDTFTKFDRGMDRFSGAFSISAYEVIASGVGKHIGSYFENADNKLLLLGKIKQVWGEEIYRAKSGSGLNAMKRLPHLIPLGYSIFSL